MKDNPPTLSELTDALLDSYRRDERTQRIGHRFLPSRTRIVEIIDEIRVLLFPGYFGTETPTDESVAFQVGSMLAQVEDSLATQVRHCLCSVRGCDDCEDPDVCTAEAVGITRQFCTRIPAIRDALALDAQAAYDGDPAAKGIDEILYCYPGFYAVMVYRIAHELLDLGVPLMPRIMSEHAHSITGTDIHPGATIGRSFFIDHATGVVVGETTTIGDNVKVYQGVTLGAKSFPKDERGRAIKGLKRHPTIEDNVTIYPNATILGGETVIGRGATVGGNAYVIESVQPEHLVLQENPRLQVLDKRKKRPSKT